MSATTPVRLRSCLPPRSILSMVRKWLLGSSTTWIRRLIPGRRRSCRKENRAIAVTSALREVRDAAARPISARYLAAFNTERLAAGAVGGRVPVGRWFEAAGRRYRAATEGTSPGGGPRIGRAARRGRVSG